MIILRSKLIEIENKTIFNLFHRALGGIYLVVFFSLFFQIVGLIGKNGLLPSFRLLQISYSKQGEIMSFIQFPSLFHFFPYDLTL